MGSIKLDTQNTKAAEIVIFLQDGRTGFGNLESVKKALSINNILKVNVTMGWARRGRDRHYSPCLRVKIPRRRFVAAVESGLMDQFHGHRIFKRSGLDFHYSEEVAWTQRDLFSEAA